MYLNAALIRELRMVYQHLVSAFGGRTPASRFATSNATLKCVYCLKRNPRKLEDAIVVYGGESVCLNHMFD